MRVSFSADGRTTPELAALRAYAPRFSYLNNYLPELYRETEFGPEADATDRSTTRADFLGRFLATFEGVFTPLEDQIAHAHLLTDARATPDEALEWLGRWIGVAFDSGCPAASRRTLLRAAPWMFRQRGTLTGLKLALEIATGGHFEQIVQDGRSREVMTGGGVTGGEIVVLEDFRLRRTFATILGADLADENDPLLAGLAVSGNSFVGDTLFLGDEHKKEFLALFNAELDVSGEEADAIGGLFERLAHRVTILVHQEVEPQDLGLIRRVAEVESPAHVQTRVLTASYPFIVGLASLVEVDTYLARKPRPMPVEVGRTHVGLRDFLQGSASLDPRLGGSGTALPPAESPVANAGPDRAEPFGQSFTLDGSGSRAGRGRRIARYIWEQTE
jgi:phage tail-like protein